MGNPEPNHVFRKQAKVQKAKIKKDRCRDSMEAILTNGVNCIHWYSIGILLSKLQKSEG